MYPEAGAEYVYLREAVPAAPWLAFFTGFVLVLAGSSTASAVSLAFGAYAQGFVALPQWLVAAGVIAICGAVAVAGITASSRVNIVFTCIEIAGLVLVIAFGVGAPSFGRALATPFDGDVLAGAALLFFVYLGFEEVANLAGEARDTARDLPRAIFISLVVTTVLYLLVSLSAVALVPVAELAGSESAMSTIARSISPLVDRILSGVALFATANTALISIIATSRMVYAMARDRQLPGPLARVLPVRKTPWLATCLVAALALGLLPLGAVATTASVSSLASLLAFVAVNVSVVLLRRSAPRNARPFRVPLAIGRVPVLPVLGAAAGVGLMTQFEPVVYLVCGGAIAVGLALYLLWIRPRRPMRSR
jgi:amino acid transporter